jgi:hypothetical protein
MEQPKVSRFGVKKFGNNGAGLESYDIARLPVCDRKVLERAHFQ